MMGEPTHRILKKATLVGFSTEGGTVGGEEFVAHICLDFEDARVFFQATSPDHPWVIVEEPR